MVLGLSVSMWCMIAAVAWLSRKEQGDIAERMSIWLYKRVSTATLLKAFMKRKDRLVQQTLLSLHPGETPTRLLTVYYIEKIKIVVLTLGVGSLLACTAELSGKMSAVVSDGTVSRGTDTQTIVLEAAVADGKEIVREEVSLEIAEREIRTEEAEILYKQLVQELERIILGENISFQEIRENMNLPYEVEGYPFSITWNSDDTMLLGTEGKVSVEDLEEPVEVLLWAKISYRELEWEHSWQLILQPPLRSEREQLLYELTKQSEEAARDSRYEESFALPGEIDGKNISWKQKAESSGMVIFFLTLTAAVAVYHMKDRDLQEELVKRKKLLKQEYPALVSKYALFLGAGMTVRGSFIKICHDYLKNNYKEESERMTKGFKKKLEIHPLYEEMLYSCNELQTGVSESRVYENFGRRTGVQEYTRLCTLLNQNLKKGNTALVRRLNEEYAEAARENLQFRKRQGEEAGTRLLLPMVMMLLMVLIMIMLPAFSGLGI